MEGRPSHGRKLPDSNLPDVYVIPRPRETSAASGTPRYKQRVIPRPSWGLHQQPALRDRTGPLSVEKTGYARQHTLGGGSPWRW